MSILGRLFYPDLSNGDKERFARNRVETNFRNAFEYMGEHPVGTGLVVGSLFLAAIYLPAPVIIALCISALVMFFSAMSKEPTFGEVAKAAVFN